LNARSTALKNSGGDGYPPYNIEQTGDFSLRITLAVAGFSMEDLDVELDNNTLTVRGKQIDDGTRIFLHRGIAARQFLKTTFVPCPMELKYDDATLDNGLLHIDLRRIVPESQVQKIAIKKAAKPTEKLIDVEGRHE